MSTSPDSPAAATPDRPDVIDRYLGMSSLWRVMIAAALLFLVYLVAEDMVWPTSDEWAMEADRLELLLDESQTIDKRIDRKLEWVIAALGPIEVPRSPNLGADRLEATVNTIVRNHNVQEYTFETRPGSRVQASSALRSIAGGGRVQRVHAEVEFTATDEEVSNVLLAMEANPEIESIGSLRLTAIPERKVVEVKLVVEAWVTAPDRRRSS